MNKQPDFVPSYLIDRKQIENAIEALLSILDAMEPDVDFEPWLAGFHHTKGDDCELDNCDDESTGDDEPYMSTGAAIWSASGGQDDLELDHAYFDNRLPMTGRQAI